MVRGNPVASCRLFLGYMMSKLLCETPPTDNIELKIPLKTLDIPMWSIPLDRSLRGLLIDM
uniref:Uncharacterized protein n=1 Tax=Romanomermis culicivorax TaxID=13658 RepID=A0A915KFB8_ROMCU